MNPLTNKKTKRVLDRRTTAGNLGAHDVGNLVQVTSVDGVEVKAILSSLYYDAVRGGGLKLQFRDLQVGGDYGFGNAYVNVDPDSKVSVWTLETPEDDA